ncbi:acetyltransferase family protein [Yersinia rochesterensis]|uniref:Acetyltransferase family protein n=1 Tax=Yersinia rochesterensis TaxID=1604335 RepID=A0ABM5SSN2_9GAMM|nr:GNAT family N-acetyltransferase [Yersinia rochesterensis]AIN17848.1 acetyltransferase family protein [Yersinia rochesterensis]AJI87481.1 acetyltransferase family protein [Yersinia frederiksenii Y225]AJJ37533.1 acetyltransferase family protein [Yersinia rochesterensis]CRY63830.1 ribosomal-protein-alanine N-acetyltransferase [Yersinia kristensenii]
MTQQNIINIRDFLEEDAEGICTLFRTVYGEHYVYPDIYMPSMIRYHNDQGKWCSAVAIWEEKIVGHAILWFGMDSKSAELAFVVVHPSVRGRGVATRLSKHLFNYAYHRALTTLSIKMVSSHPRTQQLAHTLGFHSIGLLLDYVDSPFGHNARESIILGVLPLQPRPLPHCLTVFGHIGWLNSLIGLFGTTPQAPTRNNAFPLQISAQGNRVDVILTDASLGSVREIAYLPLNRLIHLSISINDVLPSLLPVLHLAGYVDTGLAPASEGQWYWLLQRGYAKHEPELLCPIANSLYAGI